MAYVCDTLAVPQEEIERGYLRTAMTLCQDTDYIVRINMCDGLQCLAAAVGLDVTVATILPEILELMKDEEPLVRVAAINSLVAGKLGYRASGAGMYPI